MFYVLYKNRLILIFPCNIDWFSIDISYYLSMNYDFGIFIRVTVLVTPGGESGEGKLRRNLRDWVRYFVIFYDFLRSLTSLLGFESNKHPPY